MGFTLGIITARGGSKGIKHKNIIPLCGKPLIHYTIEAALKAPSIDDVILSTDDQDIADCANDAGLACHGLRPDHLATDEAKSSDVIAYEIDAYERRKGQGVDTVLLLQPTAPLRTMEDIDAAYELYNDGTQKSLISCYNAETVHPRIMYEKNGVVLTPFLKAGHTIIGRQKMEPVYVRNGAIYMVERDYFMETGRLICDAPALYEMSRECSVNIDAPEDLELAVFYLEKRSC